MFEYPKWVDDVLVEGPDAEDALRAERKLPPREPWTPPAPDSIARYVPVEYPKWIGENLVNDEAGELALMEAAEAIEAPVESAPAF